MLRLDSEQELESHELGRSFLFMVREDDAGFESFPQHDNLINQSSPFDVVRERLAAIDLAFRELQLHVHVVIALFSRFHSSAIASLPLPSFIFVGSVRNALFFMHATVIHKDLHIHSNAI